MSRKPKAAPRIKMARMSSTRSSTMELRLLGTGTGSWRSVSSRSTPTRSQSPARAGSSALGKPPRQEQACRIQIGKRIAQRGEQPLPSVAAQGKAAVVDQDCQAKDGPVCLRYRFQRGAAACQHHQQGRTGHTDQPDQHQPPLVYAPEYAHSIHCPRQQAFRQIGPALYSELRPQPGRSAAITAPMRA